MTYKTIWTSWRCPYQRSKGWHFCSYQDISWRPKPKDDKQKKQSRGTAWNLKRIKIDPYFWTLGLICKNSSRSVCFKGELARSLTPTWAYRASTAEPCQCGALLTKVQPKTWGGKNCSCCWCVWECFCFYFWCQYFGIYKKCRWKERKNVEVSWWSVFWVLFTSGLNDSMISQSFGWKETPSFGKLSSPTTKLIGLLRGGPKGKGFPNIP